MILKPDVMLMKRNSCITQSSSGALDSRLDLTEDGTSQKWQQSILSVKCDVGN